MSVSAVKALLANDPVLASLGITSATIHDFSTVGTGAGDPIVRPFLVLRWGDTLEPRWRHRQGLRVDVHDEALSDYTRVNSILDRVREVLTAPAHVYGADGYVLTQADYQGMTTQTVDPVYETVTRGANFVVLARKAA